ncbi:MAG: DUF2335 domain-containing protein [Synergistaceae bacterium]|nr:DUF2335 domain-containing protein [Synergistaceae bacterium]
MSRNIKSVPTQQKKNPHEVSIVASSQSLTYSGPLPPASEIAMYEKVCPGSADRILKMAEQQAKHRQNIEAVAVKTSSERSILGVKYAFYSAISAFVLSGVCFCLGQTAAGGAIFGGTLVSLVTAFIYGTKSSRQEREEKWEKAHGK